MNNVLKNTSALFSAHLIGRLLSLCLTFLLASTFSQESLGGYILASSITSMITSIAELGMHAPLIREITLNLQKVRHFLGNALIIRILLSVVAFGVMLGSGTLLGYPTVILQMIALLGLAELINLTAQLFRCVFRGFEQMKYEAFTVVTERVLVVLIGGVSVVYGASLLNVCIIILGVSLFNLLLNVGIVLAKFTTFDLTFDLEIWSTLMRQALPFALGNMFNIVYFRLDAIMISKISPDGMTANAWYGLAYTIVNAFTILPGAFMGAMFPMMSRAIEDEKAEFPAIYTHAMKWMFLIGLPFAVGIATLATQISTFLFPKYSPTTIAPALRLLGWSGGLIFLTTVVLTVLRAADKRYPFVILMGTTTLLNLGLNFLLIPRFSHIGAAVTMIVSEAYLFIAGFIYVSLRFSTLTHIGFVFKSIVASGAMGLGLMVLRAHVTIWLLIPLAIIFYSGWMTVSGEVRWNITKSNP